MGDFMGENALNLPREYFSSASADLTRYAQLMCNRTLLDMYHNEETNRDYALTEKELQTTVFCLICCMFNADGEVNESEHRFAQALFPELSSRNWVPAEEDKKSLFGLLYACARISELRNAARDLIRIAAIAAVIDTSSINAKESEFLLQLIEQVNRYND